MSTADDLKIPDPVPTAFPTARGALPDEPDPPPVGRVIRHHFARHAMLYVIVIGLGAQGFCTAFYDNFWTVEPADMAKIGWWQVAALFLKSLAPALGVAIGYILKPVEPKQ